MRLRAFRDRTDALRCALLSGRDPVHYFRSRGRVSISLGGGARRHRDLWLLVDDRVLGRADRRLHVRMEERRARMGVIETPGRAVQPGGSTRGGQDLLLRAATEEIQDRGFILSTVDTVINWAR